MNTLFNYGKLAALLSIVAVSFSGCDDDEPAPLATDKDILTFTFPSASPAITPTISGTNITADAAYNQDITALVPTITVSEKASVQPASGVAQNFTNPVTYTVTAEDGSTKAYTVTVTKATPPTLVVTTVWEKNLNNNARPTWFTANNDRDLAMFGDYIYVHNNNDKIRVVSKADGSDVTAGANGFIDGKQNFSSGNLFLLGTDTDATGRIVASNLRNGGDALPKWNVYVWNDKDAAQELLFEYPTPTGYRLGENLTVIGDVRGNATVYTPGGGFGAQNNKVLKFTITGGTPSLNPTVIELAGLTNMGNAPDVHPVSSEANANLIVAGTGVDGIAEYTQAGVLVGKLPAALKEVASTKMLFTFALDVVPFTLEGRKIVATTATDFTANAADAGYLYLIDYTDGWENVTEANIKRVALTPAGNIDPNFNGTGGVDVVVNGTTATVYAMITNFGLGAYTVTVD